MDDAKLILKLEARTRKFERDLKKAIDKLDGNVQRGNRAWNKGMSNMERRTKRFSSNIKGQFAGLGTLGVGALLTISTRTIADFRQSMATVQAVTGATTTEFALLEDKARSLGATTRFSASEAAEGMVALGRAGLTTSQVMDTIEGTLLLAQSGALELGEASEITAGTLNGFRLEASDAGRVVDVLSKAANSSATDVTGLGQAMSFVSPISATLGISLEETTAAISALADNNIKGTRSGTGLRKILISLAGAGKDFSAEAGGLQGVLKRLSAENINLGAASDLVGEKQAASLLILLNSVDKVGQLTTAYEGAAGSAAQAARIMDDNLNGALLATKSRAQELQIALGEAGGEQALINGLENLQGALTFVAENATTFQKALIVLAATTAGLIGGSAIGGLITSLGVARTAFLTKAAAANAATLSLKGVSLGVKQLLVALGPAGWVAIAVGAIAAFAQFGSAADRASQNIDNFDSTLGKLSKVNQQLKTDNIELKGLMEDLAAANIAVGDAAQAAKVLEIGALNARIAKNKELGETYKTLLRAQITSGKAEVARVGRKQLGLTKVVAQTDDEFREKRQAGLNKLLKDANDLANRGERLTKKQTKALELQVEQAEALAKVANAEQQLLDLEAPEVVAQVSAPIATLASPPAQRTAEVDKKLESELEAIAKLGQTEREQIAELLAERLAAIDKSTKAESVKSDLRSKAHADAKSEIADLLLAENEAIAKTIEEMVSARQEAFDLHQDELGFLAEIEAAQARAAGNTLEATRIELDAVKDRYEAELAYIDELIKKNGLNAELSAQRANAQAGVASTDASITEVNDGALEDFDALTTQASSRLEAELDFINEAEGAKLERLEELRTEELEALRDFEAEKSAIESEADQARLDAKVASIKTQLATTENLLSGITSALQAAGKENSKAAKIAAKAQQVVALGSAIVNTAQGVSSALATGNIPKAFLVGALGAIQVGVIASQTFEGGGPTGSGARVGGVDGKGGFNAVLHPQEVVADMTKPGREVGGKSLAEAFGLQQQGAALPRGVRSSSISGAGRSGGDTFSAGDFVVQGNVDEGALPALEAAMNDFRKNQKRDFNLMAEARDRRTKPRTERRVGRRAK